MVEISCTQDSIIKFCKSCITTQTWKNMHRKEIDLRANYRINAGAKWRPVELHSNIIFWGTRLHLPHSTKFCCSIVKISPSHNQKWVVIRRRFVIFWMTSFCGWKWTLREIRDPWDIFETIFCCLECCNLTHSMSNVVVIFAATRVLRSKSGRCYPQST